MYEKLPTQVNYPELESEIVEFWKEHNIFKRSVEERPEDRQFIFYEGPPTANGKPGIHHVISRTIKDLICRYKTMQGFRVERKAGWDTHGLPVEIEVEKKLGLDSKEKIVEYGVAEFNQKCKDSVFQYLKDWDILTERIGFWVDLDEPYITYENNYIETVWWILDNFFKRDLIYKGHKILPFCPRCETPLSSHEVSLGYKDVSDPSIFVKAKVKGEDNTYFLLWTTTPWTLISNVALAVSPTLEYVYADTDDGILILAKELLDGIKGKYKILKTVSGKELAGMEYEQIFPFCETDKKAFYVITGEFVSAEEGSGIVHIAPAFGADDYNVGVEYGLPVFQPVNEKGEFTEEVTAYKGLFVKTADPKIIEDLTESGMLYESVEMVHSYPHCWRCDTPLLYYARQSWYIQTTKFKDRLLNNNEKVWWQPKEVGEKRFHSWLENNIDWSLSRDRFWGTPLNIWLCEDCDNKESIGSVEELKKRSLTPLSEPLDLHKPYIDDVIIKCTECGSKMIRTPEVIDCWFDSGSMPFAQLHYPFENKDKFDIAYPSDFISEAVDQTRGWFYSLLAISALLFDKPAYKSCLCMDMILDKHGKKMSKSKGNTVDPIELLDNEGADAIRWYLISNSPPWVPTKFDVEGVQEVIKKFFGTLTNTYTFFVTYANIDEFSYKKEEVVPGTERPEIDRWLISSLAKCVEDVNKFMDNYEITKATRVISEFVIDDLSNWYVRLNRRRFWKSENGKDKMAAYQTLYETLITISRLMAPISPFLPEWIFRNLRTHDDPEAQSVHLEKFPLPGDTEYECRDDKLVERMTQIRRVCFLVRSLRSKSNLKIRQPLSELLIEPVDEKQKEFIESGKEFILNEVNIKNLKFIEDKDALLTKVAKPNFGNLGPKLGKKMKAGKEVITDLDPDKISEFEKNGSLTIEIEGENFTITESDLEIATEDMPGLVAVEDFGMTVGINTNLTDELLNEGFAREFVNRIQNMRKEAGFEVIDRIRVFLEAESNIIETVEVQKEYIKRETLTKEISTSYSDGEYSKIIEFVNGTVKVGIERVKA
ncbi:MAG: isoleucine--tRNA ligase [bacterium]|nr:isoleucine--tRNA ligase [bacterium]